MLLLRIVMVALLGLVFWQDIKSRSVYGFAFPLIACCGFALQLLSGYPFKNILFYTTVNIVFLIVQALLVRLYFGLKNGWHEPVIDRLIGWGDLLFLLSAAFFLPFIVFFTYYLVSLLLISTGWTLYRSINRKDLHVPLAGLQAALLLLLAGGDWVFGWNYMNEERWLSLFLG